MSDLELGKIGDSSNAVDASLDVGQSAPTLQTLNEPVSQTLLRDLRQVGLKLKVVMIPTSSGKELRNWDLWGPLFLCLIMASTLSFTAQASQTALVFAAVFVIVWCGAAIVTLNAALLGGNISFLQSVCVLGYCMCPLNIASIVCLFGTNHVFRLVVVGVMFLWATRASLLFMAQLVPEDRRALGVYPVLLFYLTIAWMILVQ